MRRLLVLLLGVSLLMPIATAGAEVALGDQKAKESYSLGFEFGENIKRQNVEVDVNVLVSAIQDALAGKEPAMSRAAIQDTMVKLRQRVVVEQDQRFREMSAKSLKEGTAFMAANKAKEGVQTFPSGLQYKVLKEGTGPIPQANDSVKVDYVGKLVNGHEFDSTVRRGQPAIVNVNGVILGWTEALQHMKVGSKWQIVVPPNLGYGERRFGRIPPNSTLIFEIELLGIEDGAAASAAGSGTAQPSATDAQAGAKGGDQSTQPQKTGKAAKKPSKDSQKKQ